VERAMKAKVPMMVMVMVKVMAVNLAKVEVVVMPQHQDMKEKDMVKENHKALHMLLVIRWAKIPIIRVKQLAMQLIPMLIKASQHLMPIQLDTLKEKAKEVAMVARVARAVMARVGIKVGANAVEDLESKARAADEMEAKMAEAKIAEAEGGLKPTELN